MIQQRNNLILFLGGGWLATLIILAIYIFADRAADPAEAAPVIQQQEYILMRKAEIFELMARERALIEERRADSIKAHQEKERFKTEISRLKKKIKEIDFGLATSDELDSIRADIYSDSAYVVAGPDPLYAMPISQARDALEAKAREPMKDGVIEMQYIRIDSLEAENRRMAAQFLEQLELNAQIRAKTADINASIEAIADHYRREAKQERKQRWIDRAIGGLVGFGIGRIKG